VDGRDAGESWVIRIRSGTVPAFGLGLEPKRCPKVPNLKASDTLISHRGWHYTQNGFGLAEREN
jgi:hypothetical protein